MLGVRRGGAFLAELLGYLVTVQVPKAVRQRPGKPDVELRTPHLEAEIRARIARGESRFAIVDFYMGGVFAGELQAMVAAIVRDHPHAQFDVLWLRETHGFERLAQHPERPHPLKPTREDLEQGVAFIGGLRDGALVLQGPGVVVPRLKGLEQNLSQLRATAFPVPIVLGDDMNMVFATTSDKVLRVFDRHGSLVREIPVGTADPVTGQPLASVKDIMIRIMEGHRFDGTPQDAQGGTP